MSGFDDRLGVARELEGRVICELQDRGWDACEFGQALLPDSIRSILRRTDSPVRWMADIVAGRYDPQQVVYVDAKAGKMYRRTGNFDIEKSSVDSARSWEQYSGEKAYFVFDNLKVATVEIVDASGTPGRFKGRGSGTPFVLVPCSACLDFDEVFGAWHPT